MITLDKQEMIETMLNRHKIDEEEARWLAEMSDETVNYRFDCVMSPAELRDIEAGQKYREEVRVMAAEEGLVL